MTETMLKNIGSQKMEITETTLKNIDLQSKNYQNRNMKINI